MPWGGKPARVHSAMQWPSDITFSWPGGMMWRQFGSMPMRMYVDKKKFFFLYMFPPVNVNICFYLDFIFAIQCYAGGGYSYTDREGCV